MLAIPWYFAQRNQSDVFFIWLGIFTAVAIVWSLYAGSVIDRFPRKRVFLGTNLVEGLVILLIACYGLYQGGLPNLPILLVFGLTLMGYNIYYPNLYAFGQEITPPKDYLRINSYLEVVGQSTRALSGAGAAMLLTGLSWKGVWHLGALEIPYHVVVKAWSIEEIFLVDGLTYFLASLLIALIRYAPYKTKEVDQGKLLERLKTGYAFLHKNPHVAIFGYTSHSIFAVAVVMIHGLIAPYISDWLVASGELVGGIQLLYSLGAVSAGFLVKRWFAYWPTPKTLLLFMALAASVCFLSGATKVTWLYLGVGCLIGFTNAGSRILRISYLFNLVPNSIIGRVNSLFMVTNTITRLSFIFLFATPWFEGAAIRKAYYVLGGFVVLCALWMAKDNYQSFFKRKQKEIAKSESG